VKFRLLGPLEVTDGDELVSVGSGKRGALLAYLLLHANEVVPADRLIEELWAGRAPATVAKSLHVHVSQLRKELGRGNGRGDEILRTRGGGYVAEVAPEDVDIRRFERLLAEGRRAGDPDTAAATLREAISMWRGPALADFAYEPFAQREITRLEELRLDALEARVEADLALGRHGELVGELEALVDEHPLREHLRGQLMLALYRSGRQADALATFREGRARLVEELGLEPGPELRELEAAILGQRPELAPPRGPPRIRRASPPAPPPRRRTRLRIALALAAGALLIACAVVFALTRDRQPSPTAAPAPLDLARNSIASVGRDGSVRFASPLPGRPTALVAEGETAWIATVASPALVGVDLGTRSIVRTVALPIRPGSVALGEGTVWVADAGRGVAVRVRPGYDEISAPIRFGRRGAASRVSTVAARGALWIADGSGSLSRVDAATSDVTRVPAGRPVAAVAAAGDAVWAISADPPSALRVDAAGKVTDTVALVARDGKEAPHPIGVAASAEGVWVLSGNTATVTRIDPIARGVAATIPIGVDRVPNAIAASGGTAWVANEDGTLSRIDPGQSAAASVWVGESLRQVAAAGSRLWVATAALDQQLPGGGG
jgi:DNA-binding SARP family transcriptional activator